MGVENSLTGSTHGTLDEPYRHVGVAFTLLRKEDALGALSSGKPSRKVVAAAQSTT